MKPNKYTPHQGPQECARRAAQLKAGKIYNVENLKNAKIKMLAAQK